MLAGLFLLIPALSSTEASHGAIDTSSSALYKPINHLTLNIIHANQIIYEYFSNISPQNMATFRADTPTLICIDGDQLLLLNAPKTTGFMTLPTLPITNHIAQYKNHPSPFLPNHLEYRIFFDDKRLTTLYINQCIFDLYAFSTQDRIALLSHLTQQLYSSYLKHISREILEIPFIDYPVADTTNLALATAEYEILLSAFQKTIPIATARISEAQQPPHRHQYRREVEDLLRQFYAIRVKRWRAVSNIVQAYETPSEKLYGLSYYHSFKLLYHLEQALAPYISPLSPPPISMLDITQSKLYRVFDGGILSINAMTQQKAENIGFMLTYLYDYMGWDYSPENTTDGLQTFLGKKLNMSTTQIDELYDSMLQNAKYASIRSNVGMAAREYVSTRDSIVADFSLHISFDGHAVESASPHQVFFIDTPKKSTIYPHTNLHKFRGHHIDITIQNQGLSLRKDRRNRFIQTDIPEHFTITIDDKNYSLKHLTTPTSFESMMFCSENVTFLTDSPGQIRYDAGILHIAMTPTHIYNIEDQYLELVEELNARLVALGVPNGWLARYINHPDFRIYQSMVRLFTSMPEHQVGRGERDQDWYMRHFGVDQKVVKGATFREAHIEALMEAERRFGIRYELIMALLAMETDYANPRWRGTFYTFPALVSQYLLLPRRQRFATNELKALYDFTKKTDTEVYYYIGSYAGAAGWGQFIPSSMNAFYVSATGSSNQIDIYNIDDTIHSIANYLRKHGLNRDNMDNYQARYNAVFAYNRSDAYVKAVLYIYDKLYAQR